MNVSNLISVRNIELNSRTYLKELKELWLFKEFDGIFDTITRNSNGTFTVSYHNFLHDNMSFNPEPVSLNCTPQQNEILDGFYKLAKLDL